MPTRLSRKSISVGSSSAAAAAPAPTKVHDRAGCNVLTADMPRSVHRLLVNRRTFHALEGQMREQTARAVAKVG